MPCVSRASAPLRVFAVFFTLLSVVTSTAEIRIMVGVLVAGTCAVMAMLFFLTVNAWESRQRRN